MEVWMADIVAALEERGWRVVVALAEGSRFHKPERYIAEYPFEDVIAIDGRSGYRECRVLSVLKILRKMEPDVAMPVGLADALYATALYKRMGGNCRLAVCVHGQSRDIIDDLELCKGYIDLFVSVSRKGCQTIRDRAFNVGERVIHIPTGVPAPTREREVDRTALHVAYVGRLDNREKRIFDLIPLVKQLADTTIVIHVVGDGIDEVALKTSLEQEIKKQRVIFHGKMTRGRLYELIYPKMDALLLFSASEGGPITAWEALAHGVVPVVSDFSGREEEGVLIHRKNALVFPVGDIKAAEQALRMILVRKIENQGGELKPSLPEEYSQDTFSRSWDEKLRECVYDVNRHANGELPSMLSNGRFSQLRLGITMSCKLRKLFSGNYPHKGAGGEWPHAYGYDKIS
jgi:glycosyltransferase involved in cell wall biosynthesis